jgi:hypothetical protein
MTSGDHVGRRSIDELRIAFQLGLYRFLDTGLEGDGFWLFWRAFRMRNGLLLSCFYKMSPGIALAFQSGIPLSKTIRRYPVQNGKTSASHEGMFVNVLQERANGEWNISHPMWDGAVERH